MTLGLGLVLLFLFHHLFLLMISSLLRPFLVVLTLLSMLSILAPSPTTRSPPPSHFGANSITPKAKASPPAFVVFTPYARSTLCTSAGAVHRQPERLERLEVRPCVDQ